MARQLPKDKIKRAVVLFRRGERLNAIAQELEVPASTVSSWKATTIWAEYFAELEGKEAEEAAQAVLGESQEFAAEYRDELVQYSKHLKQILLAQLKIASQLNLVAAGAIAEARNSTSPLEAGQQLAKDGICYLTQTAAQLSKNSNQELDRLYAVDKVLEFAEDLALKGGG